MASKKDKFSRVIKKRIEESLPGAGSSPVTDMIDSLASVRSADPEEQNLEKSSVPGGPVQSETENILISAENITPDNDHKLREGYAHDPEIEMARTRESIYNVSSDIRLEDYAESGGDGGTVAGLARVGAGLALACALAYGGWILLSPLFAPGYVLAVSAQRITPAQAGRFAEAESVTAAPGSPLYIYFQWEEGELSTDYVRIKFERVTAGGHREEALIARRPPVTANYIQGYFESGLPAGQYRISVSDRDGAVLTERTVQVD